MRRFAAWPAPPRTPIPRPVRAWRTPTGAALLTAAQMLFGACALTLDEGLAVDLALRPMSAAVTLEEGWLHLADARLEPCDDARATRWPAPFGPALARAHHAATDAGLGAHVVPLGRGAVDVGALRPAPGRYCALRVIVSPAEAAADGFVEPMRDRTLRATGARAGAPLALDGWGSRDLTLPLVDADGRPAELALDPDHPAGALTLELDLAPALQDVDPAADAETLGLTVLGALESTLTARVAR